MNVLEGGGRSADLRIPPCGYVRVASPFRVSRDMFPLPLPSISLFLCVCVCAWLSA